jgi:hypothetical protein
VFDAEEVFRRAEGIAAVELNLSPQSAQREISNIVIRPLLINMP